MHLLEPPQHPSARSALNFSLLPRGALEWIAAKELPEIAGLVLHHMDCRVANQQAIACKILQIILLCLP